MHSGRFPSSGLCEPTRQCCLTYTGGAALALQLDATPESHEFACQSIETRACGRQQAAQTLHSLSGLHSLNEG